MMKHFLFFKNYLKNNLSDVWLDRVKFFREVFIFIPNYLNDAYRYARYSATRLNVNNKNELRAMLIKNFHIIEKGLSLPSPRPGFGRVVVDKTISQLEQYLKNHGVDVLSFQVENALNAYIDFNKLHNQDVSHVESSLQYVRRKFLKGQSLSNEGGVLTISREEILHKATEGFKGLAENRFSIRVFDEEPVSLDLIKKAADISRKTPSVCNRQTARIFIFGGNKKDDLLALQNGNRGFGHTASHVAVITSDLHCFTGIGERNQAYVDGGLMAMSFVYALQSLGVGSCFLNWSVTFGIDRELKKLADIPSSHVVVTLIAIGNIPAELKVAASPRLCLSEVCVVDDSCLQ
jgi:nitroreductase